MKRGLARIQNKNQLHTIRQLQLLIYLLGIIILELLIFIGVLICL